MKIPFNFGKKIKKLTPPPRQPTHYFHDDTVERNWVIRDNSSGISRCIPKEWVEPLTIIAMLKGYDGVDEYVVELIRSRLEMFADSRDELGEDFQNYMNDIMINKKDVKKSCTPNSDFVEKEELSEKEEAETK